MQKREEIRGSMGITDQFVIGHVGNFCYQKNHYFLLDVFEEVHKKDPNTVLLLAGDGVRFEKVRQIVAEKNLEDVVKLLGRRVIRTICIREWTHFYYLLILKDFQSQESRHSQQVYRVL